MSITSKFHVIKFNREEGYSPKNTLEIDDKKIEGITNVKIEYGLDNPYPVVTIELLAKEIKGQAKRGKLTLNDSKSK